MKRSLVFLLVFVSMSLNLPLISAQETLNRAYSANWSPDGRILAINGNSGLWFYDIEHGTLEHITSDFAFIGWTSNNHVFTGRGFFNPITRHLEDSFELQRPQDIFSTRIGLSHDTTLYALLEGDYLDTIVIYSTETGAPIRRINTTNPNAGAVTKWSPDNTLFAMQVGNRPSVLIIPNTETPTILEYSIKNSPAYQQDQFLFRFQWSPDGDILAIGTTQAIIFLLDVQSETFFGSLESQVPMNIAWSPDGKRLAASNMDGTITVWDVETEAILEKLQTTGLLYDLEFSPYGGVLAIANDIEKALQHNSDGSPRQLILSTNNPKLYIRSIGERNAVQLFVPAPSLQRFAEIASFCGAPATLTAFDTQPEDSIALKVQIETLLQQLADLPENAIPFGCTTDLTAILEALKLAAA
ncbi:MAG TPA: WD40 repeat domain-containing protein [Phototrophicaceae bacterium]|nr:WD40 repeat domain-containing protein [Phototrophicaceae bacterium]